MRSLSLAACLALALYGCGSGVVCFGGSDCGDDDDDERTVTIEGNLDTVRPPNAVRDLVVFVYTGIGAADLADGPPFDDFVDADSAVVGDDDTFDMEKIRRGNLTVIVLRDDPEPDGSIDTGDDCSVLRDGGDLSDVAGGRRVTIEDMDVDFDPVSCPSPAPAAGCGCSTADDIVIGRDDSSGGGSSNDDAN
jgi:hypothetical protein